MSGVFLESSNSASKCGEILRADTGKYVFLCFHCAAEFGSAIEIMEHIEDAHFPAPVESLMSISGTEKTHSSVNAPKTQRKQMRRTVSRPYTKNTAMVTETCLDKEHQLPGPAEDSETSSPDKPIVDPVTIPHNGMHECTKCGIHISGKAHFRLHMESHANKKPHKCEICARGFNLKSALRLHQKMHKLESSNPAEQERAKTEPLTVTGTESVVKVGIIVRLFGFEFKITIFLYFKITILEIKQFSI